MREDHGAMSFHLRLLRVLREENENGKIIQIAEFTIILHSMTQTNILNLYSHCNDFDNETKKLYMKHPYTIIITESGTSCQTFADGEICLSPSSQSFKCLKHFCFSCLLHLIEKTHPLCNPKLLSSCNCVALFNTVTYWK